MEGKEENIFDRVKDAMENMRIKICVVIKEKIFMKISEEAARQYESSREIAMREALEKAIEVKKKENEDIIRMICNQIKEKYMKELFTLLYKASSQSLMIYI